MIIFPLQSLAPKFCLRPSCIFWQDHPGVSVLEVAVFPSGFLKHDGGSLTPGVPLAKDPTRLCGQINCGVWLTFTLLTSMSICFRRRQSFRPTELSSYSERLLIVGQDPWRTLHLLTLWIFHNSNFEGPWNAFEKGLTLMAILWLNKTISTIILVHYHNEFSVKIMGMSICKNAK